MRRHSDARAEERHDACAGQVMLEYVIVAGMLLAAVAMFAVFFYTFQQHGGRVLDLVASEYP